jgi:cell division inhibitor SulA
VDLKMTILRDSVTQPEANIGKAFSDIACNSRETPRKRVNQLLHSNPNLWRGCDMAGQGFHGIGTGYHELDDILPGRGWPSSGLVEVIARHSGMGELQLLIPLMQSVIKQGKWILCVAPPYLLNAPALTQAGIDIVQILIVKQDTPCKDALWSMEKAMQTETCGLVLAWQNWLPGKVLRRLQLAAEVGDTLAVLFKHNNSKYSPSSLRLQIKGSATDNRDFSQAEVTVIKARGNFRPLSAQFNLYPKTLSA